MTPFPIFTHCVPFFPTYLHNSHSLRIHAARVGLHCLKSHKAINPLSTTAVAFPLPSASPTGLFRMPAATYITPLVRRPSPVRRGRRGEVFLAVGFDTRTMDREY